MDQLLLNHAIPAMDEAAHQEAKKWPSPVAQSTPQNHITDSVSNATPVICIGHNREMPDLKLTAIDTNALPWEERPTKRSAARSIART